MSQGAQAPNLRTFGHWEPFVGPLLGSSFCDTSQLIFKFWDSPKIHAEKKRAIQPIQEMTGRSLLIFFSKIKDFIDSMTLDQ